MQIILVVETRASCQSDYKYIKSAIDYFYVERKFQISKVFAKTKSELINCDEKIKLYKSKYPGPSKVIVCADYDNPNDPDNIKIQQYCASNGYDLVWMNVDVEDVFLGRTVSKKMKNKELMNFLKHKESFLSTNTVLNNQTPLVKRPASNLLNVLDKYLRRKT